MTDQASSDSPQSPLQPERSRESDDRRLRALQRYDILDTPPEETFDRISNLAAALFDAPIGLITFLDNDRQWHKACLGLDTKELDLDTSFCTHTLEDAQRLVVEDATEDERFEENALVTGDHHIRFYAGSPMVTPDGWVLGTVCVLDTKPRSPSEQTLDQLDTLAQMAVDQLEQRRRHKIETSDIETNEQGAVPETSETRLNELLAALDDVVWKARVHPAGPHALDSFRSELLYTNSSEERVYRRPTGAFMQDPMLWRSAAHPEDRADLPTTEGLLADGEWRGEYRLLEPDGTTRWVETSIWVVGRPPRVDSGEETDGVALEAPVKLAGITRDIHPRKQAEATAQAKSDALAKEKSRLQMALDAANAGVFEWSIPEDQRVWDERTRQIFGLDQAPESTGALLEKAHPDDQGTIQEAMGTVLGHPDKKTCSVKYRIPQSGGTNRHVQARGVIERDETGEATRMTGIYQDVTDREKRREVLRRSERQFDAVFQDPGLLAGVLTPDGTLLKVNETALNRIEEDRADVVGRPFWETPWWAHDASLQDRLRTWIERAADGEYVPYQSELVGVDRGRYIVRGNIRPVLDEDGVVTSLVVSARDVTDRENRRRELEIFRQAVEDAADGIAVLIDGTYVYVDQTHVDLYGFDHKDQLLGESWRTLYDEDEVQRLEETVFPTLEDEGHWQGAVKGTRPDGSTFPAELSLTLTDEERLVCTVRDLTQHHEHRRKWELLSAASETGIAEWDVRSDRIQWNGMLSDLLGTNPETFEAFVRRIHPDDRPPRNETH